MLEIIRLFTFAFVEEIKEQIKSLYNVKSAKKNIIYHAYKFLHIIQLNKIVLRIKSVHIVVLNNQHYFLKL